MARIVILSIIRQGDEFDGRRRRPVASHVAAERLSGGEHDAARVAPVDVAGGGALAGPRAEQEVEAVGVHPRALVAGAVASQRLERGERAAAGPAPEGAAVNHPRPAPVVVMPAAALGDRRLAHRREGQREQQEEAVCARRPCIGHDVVVHGSRTYVLAVVITNTQPLSFDQY